jgi:hypothetical protein
MRRRRIQASEKKRSFTRDLPVDRRGLERRYLKQSIEARHSDKTGEATRRTGRKKKRKKKY